MGFVSGNPIAWRLPGMASDLGQDWLLRCHRNRR